MTSEGAGLRYSAMQNNLKTRIVVGILLILAGGVAGLIWFNEASSPALPDSTQTKIFVIRKGESVRQIAERLSKEKLIRSPVAFFLIVKQKNLAKKIQAGDFRLLPAMSAVEIAEELTHGTLDVWITIPEGWRNGQIAMELARKVNIPEAEFLAFAREGYMFPDTYLVPKEASATAVIAIFEKNFANKVEKAWATDDVITLASIVEREAKFDEDRSLVAGVLSNRLQNNMPLQADATLQYIKGYDEATGAWWPRVNPADKDIDSRYNTYKYPGLPPGPIANPGLASIAAVVDPAETDYLYYISEPDGTIHYAKTLEEHNENIRKYLR